MLKINSLTLDHVAGVATAHLEIPESGVLVVHGPNEQGKSTLLRAIRLLLDNVPTGSKKREVKALKDVSADEPTTITADLTVGDRELEITKSYNKGGGRCELRVTAPRAENLTGREASDRFADIMATEVDAALLDALTIEQGESMELLAAAGLAPLERALGSSAGDTGQDDNAGSAAGAPDASGLVDRIAAERARYYTATGRPTKELKAAEDEFTDAQTEQAAAQSRYDQAQGLITDLERLRAEKEGIVRQEPAALADAEKAASDLAAGREAQAKLEKYRGEVTRASQALELAQQRHRVRTEKIREIETAGNALEQAEEAVRQAREAADSEREQEKELRTRYAAARRASWTAKAYVGYMEALRAHHTAVAARDAAAQKKEDAEGTAEQVRDMERQVSDNPATGDAVSAIHAAAAELRRAESVRDAAATTVGITGIPGVGITVDGDDRTLDDGTATVHATSRRELVLGDFTVTVTPAHDLGQVQDDVDRARSTLDGALADVGASTVEEAEERAAARRAGAERLAELKLELGRVTGGVRVDDLARALDECVEEVSATRSRVGEARGRITTEDPDGEVDLPGIAAVRGGPGAEIPQDEVPQDGDPQVGIPVVQERAAQEERTAESVREDLDALARAGAVVRLDGRVTERDRQASQLARLTTGLDEAREETTDEALATAVAQGEQDRESAEQALQQVTDELECSGAVAVTDLSVLEGLADGARSRVDRLRERSESVSLDISRANGALGEHSGVAERREEAEARLQRAQRYLDRVTERATAADVLHRAVEQARSDARQRYEAPFRRSFEKLALTLYGRAVDFEFDEDLGVSRRVLDAAALDTAQLSGGAQEQIAVLSRLAVADIVGGGDAVPIIIDDALGFSDAGRVQRMNLVLSQLGMSHQIIVLTCDPARFDSVPGATMTSMDTVRNQGV